jgi:hypothetical protein
MMYLALLRSPHRRRQGSRDLPRPRQGSAGRSRAPAAGSHLKPAEVYQWVGHRFDASTMGRSNSEASYEIDASDVVLSPHSRSHLARIRHASREFRGRQAVCITSWARRSSAISDFLQPGMHEEIEARGQRVATFLTYLSDDYDGGETEFSEVGYKFKARKGDALMFLNVSADGATDPMSMHAGLPPIRGEKWLLSLCFAASPSMPTRRQASPRAAAAGLVPRRLRRMRRRSHHRMERRQGRSEFTSSRDDRLRCGAARGRTLAIDRLQLAIFFIELLHVVPFHEMSHLFQLRRELREKAPAGIRPFASGGARSFVTCIGQSPDRPPAHRTVVR